MLTLAFSPCPNDTFMFYALLHQKVDCEGLDFRFVTDDVETLNQRAMEGIYPVSKISYHAYLYLTEKYCMLQSGSALGFGTGPLLISNIKYDTAQLPDLTMAVPGQFTTANLLRKLLLPEPERVHEMVFSDIENCVLNRKADCGVIIHENRFTYAQKGLYCMADLGLLWESRTGLPVPLGGIAVRKDIDAETAQAFARTLKRSIQWAFAHPEKTMSFVKQYAQEMDEDVMQKHIRLYVNNYSENLGNTGTEAVFRMFEIAHSKGMIGQVDRNDVFLQC